MSLWSRLWDWLKFEPKESTPGRDQAVEEGPSLSPYVSRFEDLPQKWAEDYVDTLPPLDPRVVSEHSINPEAGHRLREFGDWSPITQVPLKPRRKAAKRKTPKKATSLKPKGSKQRPASPKKPQKIPKGKARVK